MIVTKKYIKKPVPVEAVLVTDENCKDVMKWFEDNGTECFYRDGYLYIKTLEDYVRGKVGECHVVRGVRGEFYPVEKNIFEETYKPVNRP